MVGGTDPGADVLGVASLAVAKFEPGRGYRRDQVDEWRRRALNTVAHLEAEIEALRVQVGDMRRRLDADVDVTGLARGLAFMASELRQVLADQDAERTWAGQELAAIVSAASDDLACELAESFPARVDELAHGATSSSRPASWLVQAIVGPEGR